MSKATEYRDELKAVEMLIKSAPEFRRQNGFLFAKVGHDGRLIFPSTEAGSYEPLPIDDVLRLAAWILETYS